MSSRSSWRQWLPGVVPWPRGLRRARSLDTEKTSLFSDDSTVPETLPMASAELGASDEVGHQVAFQKPQPRLVEDDTVEWVAPTFVSEPLSEETSSQCISSTMNKSNNWEELTVASELSLQVDTLDLRRRVEKDMPARSFWQPSLQRTATSTLGGNAGTDCFNRGRSWEYDDMMLEVMQERRALPPEEDVQEEDAAFETRFLGDMEDLISLADEFKYNAAFARKVERLAQHDYVGWRRVRGDGNCFYRAVAFAIVEYLGYNDVAARSTSHAAWGEGGWGTRFLKRLQALGGSGEQEVAEWSEARDALVDALVALRDRLPPWRWSKDKDTALISALRHLTAKTLIDAKSDVCATGCGISFETILLAEGHASVEDFCKKVVLPMGVEAEGVVMNGMALALQAGLRVAVLDRSDGSPDVMFADYQAPELENAQTGQEGTTTTTTAPLIHLQLRPGHYDLLYHAWRHTADNDDSSSSSSSKMPTLLSSGARRQGQSLSSLGSGGEKSLEAGKAIAALMEYEKHGYEPLKTSHAVDAMLLPTKHVGYEKKSDLQKTRHDTRPPTFGREDCYTWSLEEGCTTGQEAMPHVDRPLLSPRERAGQRFVRSTFT